MADQDNTTDGVDSTNLNISESADKIRLETQVKRGEGTRDEDRLKVKVKGSDPEDTAARLAETLAELDQQGVADTLRDTQAGASDD